MTEGRNDGMTERGNTGHNKKRDVFLDHGCPRQQQNQKVLHFDPAHPQGHVMSVKYDQHLGELTVQFGYCMTTQTLNIALCKRDGITDKETNGRQGQTNGQTDIQTRGIKMMFLLLIHSEHIWSSEDSIETGALSAILDFSTDIFLSTDSL